MNSKKQREQAAKRAKEAKKRAAQRRADQDPAAGWANQNQKNQGARAFTADLYGNRLTAKAQTDSTAYYADVMMPREVSRQRAMQDIATGASLKEKAAEGAITRDLEKQRGEFDVKRTQIQFDAERYGADRDLEGTKYQADRGLDSTRTQTASAERQIGLTGEEERKTMGTATDQTLRLRADARGAIRATGSSFYGRGGSRGSGGSGSRFYA